MALTFAFKIVLAALSIYLFQKERFVIAAIPVCIDDNEEFSLYDVINTVQEIGRKISYAQWDKVPLPPNVILSPLSIAIILNLLMLGTNGTSNLQIKQALNYKNNLQESVVHESYEKILTSLPQSGNGVEISIHTRLFPQKGFLILNTFYNVSESSYLSEVESLDYANFPENSTERINNWVSNSTKGKIEKVFDEPLNPLTVCVIANVIFLNATWENQFDSNSTRNGSFYTETETITIPMMSRPMYVPYMRFDNDGFEIISLPYVGNRFSMYIIKPISGNNLQQIESTLNPNNLNTFISQMQSQSMDVTIPKMMIKFEISLKEDLVSLGVNDIFDESLADLSRFTSHPKVYVTKIAHKAVLEVTEAGTVAAAVTVAVVGTTSLGANFELNEPSLAFIRDNEKCVTVFWGRIMKPETLMD